MRTPPEPIPPFALDPLGDLRLLDRWLAGECDPEELRAILAWGDADPQHGSMLNQLRDRAKRPFAYPEITSAVDAWERLRPSGADEGGRITGRNRAQSTRGRAGVRILSGRGGSRSQTLHRWRVGGIICAALIVAFGVVAIGRTVYRGVSGSETVQTFSTRTGQFRTVRLHQGTLIQLAPATSVRVAVSSAGAVQAMMSGEAYFTVASHASHPFTVQTRNAILHVLGTRFSIRQYQDDANSRVVVDEGRVLLSSAGTSRAAIARAVVSSRMVAFVSDSGVTVSSGIATREYTSWTHGTLVFDHAPMRDIISELSHVYGADVRIADSTLANAKLAAEVDVGKMALSQVLDMIGFAMDAHIVKTGNAYMLVPGRGANDGPRRPAQGTQFPQPEQQYGR